MGPNVVSIQPAPVGTGLVRTEYYGWVHGALRRFCDCSTQNPWCVQNPPSYPSGAVSRSTAALPPLLRKIGNPVGESLALGNIGFVYARAGEPQKALDH